jgi:hypothetical protein
MTVILHPPEDVLFSGDAIPAEDQTRIARIVRAAVRRAVENAATGPATRSVLDRSQDYPDGQDLQELFDPARADLDLGVYQIPSYRGKGKLTGVELLKGIPPAEPGYDVVNGPSPLDGRVIIGLPRMRLVTIASPRYVTAGTLTQAYLLGLDVFGTTSFAIMQGPWGSPTSRYWAVGTDPAIAVEDLGERQAPDLTQMAADVLRAGLAGRVHIYVGELISPVIFGTDGEYSTRGFITKDDVLRWPSVAMAAVWYAQIEAEQQKGVTAPPAEEARLLVFSDIDRLVAQIEGGDSTNLQRAAWQLSRLGWRAFSLVDWEAKVGYLKVLLAAATEDEEEVAIVQIFKSLGSDSEVDAVIAMLKQAGRYDQLFDDLDNELYDLLVTVGERFPKDHGPLTFDGFFQLLRSLGLIPTSVEDVLSAGVGLAGGPLQAALHGRSVTDAMYDEAHDAVMGLAYFGADLWQSVETTVTEPEKVIVGAADVARLLFEVYLANVGYQPAVEKITNLLEHLGGKVLAGIRGADRLGCGEKVVRRITWRLVWEIASLFVGVGEIKAVAQGAALWEKLAGVMRFLAVLTRLGEVLDADVEGERLARLATMIKAERPAFASVEETAELLSRLPDNDIRRLGKLVSEIEIEIREGETLAELRARGGELCAVIDDVITKTELLKAMAGKAGGLTDEIVEAFHALIGDDGLPLADAHKVVGSIPEGEGARFAAMLKEMPPGRLAESSRAALLELVAASTSQMDAVADLGVATFTSVYRRAGGRAEMVDRYLAVLDEIKQRLTGRGDSEVRRLLDRLVQDDPAAWLDVENRGGVTARERGISRWARRVSGSPRAQRGLDMLLRGSHDDLVAEIMDMPGKASRLHPLELVSELTPKQIDGLAAIKRAQIDFGGEMGGHDWAHILDLDREFRNDLLDLVADVEGVVDDGLDIAVKQVFSGNRKVQGTLGHFFAARTLKNRFPGARFRFELRGVRREVDIEMNYQGRRIDVEVKTNMEGEPSVNNWQIEKDLEKHIGDRWENMLYLYSPQAGNLAEVERAMLRALRRLKLPMPLADAEELLLARMNASPPLKLVDVFTY